MTLLTEFVLRLAFGLAAGMALVSPRQVTSGYFRNHLYVTMGLALFAGLLARPAHHDSAFIPSMIAAALSYTGSICWLYEKPRAGKAALTFVAAAALLGAVLVAQGAIRSKPDAWWHYAHVVTSGATLGVVMAAMLLGHWYLNAPGMQLAPLRRLLLVAAIVVTLHALLCGVGVARELSMHHASTQWWLFLALRWSFGLVGVLILIAMAWRTLEIPNTQSATGILYVAVIGTFVGETMSLLLSAESAFPL
jgi:hypothetical protein